MRLAIGRCRGDHAQVQLSAQCVAARRRLHVMGVQAEDLALEEFKSLRNEILAKQQHQAASIGVALTAVGTLVTLAVAKNNARTELLLALPLVLTGLGAFYIGNSRGQRRMGRYLRTGTADLPARPNSWEAHLLSYRGRSALEILGFVIIFIAPSVIALAVTEDFREDAALDDLWYGGAALLVLLGLFVLGSLLSDRIAERKP
jgi:hypothetical protein